MRVFSKVLSQKFWRLVDDHVINSTLHRAEEMMVKVGNVDSLVYHQVKGLPRVGVVIGERTTNSIILRGPQGRVIALYANRSKVVM